MEWFILYQEHACEILFIDSPQRKLRNNLILVTSVVSNSLQPHTAHTDPMDYTVQSQSQTIQSVEFSRPEYWSG